MKIKDIRGMGKESLDEKLLELKKELVKVNAQVAMGTAPKSPGQVKTIKKTIAKILTVLKEKPLENKTKGQEVHQTKEKEKEVGKKA